MGNFQNIVWLFGALRGKEKILNHEDTKGTKKKVLVVNPNFDVNSLPLMDMILATSNRNMAFHFHPFQSTRRFSWSHQVYQ